MMSFRRRPVLRGVLLGIALVFAGRLLANRTSLPDYLVRPLLLPDTTGRADAIVVLGAGVVGTCTPNLNAVRRVMLAARLYHQGVAPLMVLTGGAPQGGCAAATAMAGLARDLGVRDANLVIESQSRSTWENATMAAPILDGKNVRRLVLVTDRLHMRRAASVFTRLGFDVRMAPVPVFEGHVDNVSMLAAGLREGAALTYYSLRGRLGAVPRGADDGLTATAGDAGAAGETTMKSMSVPVSNPSGPLVILGASYAKNVGLTRIGDVPVLNKGVAGQQSFELLERFDSDVVAERPRAVLLWGFINDIFRADDAERALARARDAFSEMVRRARAAGIEPILATEVAIRPPDSLKERAMALVGRAMGKESHQDRVNRHVMSMNAWLADLGRREGLLVVDLNAAVSDESGRRRREFIDADGSHITPEGYRALRACAAPILERHFSGELRP